MEKEIADERAKAEEEEALAKQAIEEKQQQLQLIEEQRSREARHPL